jgi:SpoVK/Ycf46/Vps4 family AAA+-type ATPase
MFWDRFSGARERYASTWHNAFMSTYFDNKDLDQHLDKEILREEIMEGPGGTLQELRKCVDQLVMVEVNNLRERMEREKGGKKKKGKGKGKKAKKIKVKDPADGQKLENYLQSAVVYNILQLTDGDVRVRDYIGSHDIMGTVMQEHLRLQQEQADQVKTKWQAVLDKWDDYAQQSLRMSKEQFELLFKSYCDQNSWAFEPSAAQVRQAVTEYCVLPLGSQVIHDLAPHHNAVLLYGFPKTGKTMLTHAVCNESGANLFNLSPASFNPTSGSQKLIQMVFRIARALAPSVIYIDQVEKIFAGKGKKKKKGDPVAARAAKMKKDLIAGLKEIESTDRVIVIGNSSAPWDADTKELCNFFRGMICCVHPDYASRMELWQKLIHKKGAELPDYQDYEMLSYMTNKYTSGAIAKMVEDTLTERRLKRLQQRPLTVEEFLPALSRSSPIFREDYDAMKEFVLKLPLTMRRVVDDDFKEAEVVDPKAKGKPGAKPGGKKK